MNLFSQSGLSGIRGAFRRSLRSRQSKRVQISGIRAAVEQVVDGSDSRIRLVNGYQKKLHDAVSGAIEYADNLVEQIPAAIELDPRSFSGNDYLAAFFVNYQELKNTFIRSSELRGFLQENPEVAGCRCCALLCMHKSEKTVMGMELSGDMLKKDVSQVAVSFSDHMLYSPAPSEAETREGLKQCLFAGLTSNALERITQARQGNRHLQDMRKILNARLLHLQHKLRSPDPRDTRVGHELEVNKLELSRIDKALMRSPRMTPQRSLMQVQEVFSQPDEFVRLGKTTLLINRMGIRIEQNSAQSVHQLVLSEVTIGRDAPRVVALLTFPTEGLLA